MLLQLFLLKTLLLLTFLPFTVFAFEMQVIDQNGTPVSNAVVSIPGGSIDAVNPAPAIMDQVKRQFKPLVLAVEKGREVVFPNSDNIRHHVYSFSEPKSFQIKLYKDNPKKPIKFDQDGIVVLGCNIHDSMIGYIFVSPWSNFQVSNESGKVSFEGAPKEVAIWHPWVKGLEKPEQIKFSELEKNNFKTTLLLTPPKPIIKLKNKFKKYYK
ncbi:MAG: plastocyanin [Oleiphilaceae bacterium]|jgi:plastocyanin